MDTYIGAFVAFVLVMAGMAIGVIVSDRRITGSCGGLANMRTEDGEPMCECGSRPGETCGTDPDARFDLDEDDDDTFDDGPPDSARRRAEPATAAV